MKQISFLLIKYLHYVFKYVFSVESQICTFPHVCFFRIFGSGNSKESSKKCQNTHISYAIHKKIRLCFFMMQLGGCRKSFLVKTYFWRFYVRFPFLGSQCLTDKNNNWQKKIFFFSKCELHILLSIPCSSYVFHQNLLAIVELPLKCLRT